MSRKGRVPGTRWALLEMHHKQTAIIHVLRSQSILFWSLDQITRGQRIENSCAVLQKSVECLSSVPSLVIAEKTFFPRAIKSSCAHYCGLSPTTGNGNLLLTGQRSLRQLFDYLLWISFIQLQNKLPINLTMLITSPTKMFPGQSQWAGKPAFCVVRL